MSVLNTETGEILDLDRAAAERRAERITLRLDAIADNYRAVLPMIREAIEKRDDLALGYRSPGDYVSDRFALTNRFAEARRNRERMPKRVYLSLIYRAWNTRRDGKTMRFIRVNSPAGGLVPVPEPK